ncbi:MAG: hypothetical protein ACRC8S_04540 [Fimbriiglobus sp.]
MATVLDRVLLDTTLPGANARRLWSAPDVVSHQLIVMTLPRLYLLAEEPEDLDGIKRQIAAGADLQPLLEDDAEVFYLADIQRADLDLLGCLVQLKTTTGPRELRFANSETADDVFTKLLHRTREQFTLVTNLPSLTERLRTPLGVLAAILLTTTILAVTVNAARDLAPPPGDPEQFSTWQAEWLRTLSRFDWRTICLLGGIASAWVQLEIHRRWRQLPSVMSLVPRSAAYHAS